MGGRRRLRGARDPGPPGDVLDGPGREEHAMPFAHIGFGGGIHQCMGQQFGYCQVKTILSWLNRNYDMEIVSEFPEPDYTAMVVGPKGKPMVRYVRKAAAAAAAE